MSTEDYGLIIGLFFAAFASGFCSGMLMRAVSSVLEKVVGR